jgi:hypothetical protein
VLHPALPTASEFHFSHRAVALFAKRYRLRLLNSEAFPRSFHSASVNRSLRCLGALRAPGLETHLHSLHKGAYCDVGVANMRMELWLDGYSRKKH